MTLSKGTLYTISAPSGAGKTSLVAALLKRTDNVQVSVSHTTRDRRNGEQDGTDYYFVDGTTFQSMLANDGFLEHAQVFGNCYGTSRQWVDNTLTQGRDVILEIDWQGAHQVRQQLPDTVSIFILPPSRNTLYERLTSRGQDDTSTIDRRMAQAADEMSHYASADYLIINDEFEQALEQLQSVLLSQRQRTDKQVQRHQALIRELIRPPS